MKLIIDIQYEDIVDNYSAELVSVQYPFAGWKELTYASETGADEMDALGELVAELEHKLGNSQADLDKIKLARWNKNVLDWKHIQPVTPLTTPMEMA